MGGASEVFFPQRQLKGREGCSVLRAFSEHFPKCAMREHRNSPTSGSYLFVNSLSFSNFSMAAPVSIARPAN